MANESNPDTINVQIEFSPDYRMFGAAGATIGQNPHGEIEIHFWKDQLRPDTASVIVDQTKKIVTHNVTAGVRRTFHCLVSLPLETAKNLAAGLNAEIKKAEADD